MQFGILLQFMVTERQSKGSHSTREKIPVISQNILDFEFLLRFKVILKDLFLRLQTCIVDRSYLHYNSSICLRIRAENVFKYGVGLMSDKPRLPYRTLVTCLSLN